VTASAEKYLLARFLPLGGGHKLKKEPIIRSPFAIDPFETIFMTEEEKNNLYNRRMDQLKQPYTVVDVLTKIYNRDFYDDLQNDLSSSSFKFESIKEPSEGWFNSDIEVKNLKIVCVESVFGQPANNFIVDICCESEFKVVETDVENCSYNRCSNIKATVRLRYQFNFIPCELSCNYLGIIYSDMESIYSLYPDAFHMDKYLLPVLKSTEDYERAARLIIEQDMHGYLDNDKMICGIEWIQNMGLNVYYGDFPENGVMGEYFLGFGKANVFDPETALFKEERINPGTILLNKDLIEKRGQLNTTATHEGIHHRLGYFFFMLQMCHGGCFSYLCKRYESKQERTTRWTTVDILELHANKLPAYILIQKKPGKAKAEELLKSYGGGRNLENLKRLIDDMAEHFCTTKTISRSRLYEFGYTEVRGIGVYLNGVLVPPYLSDLGKNQTYTIDEIDGVHEYVSNSKFRKVIDTGLYVYVEGHYCLNDRKYVAYDHFGDKHLTMYAREHMRECCLVFDIKYESIIAAVGGNVLRKTSAKKIVTFTGRNGESLVTAEGREINRRIDQEIEEEAIVEKSFNQITVDLMALKHITVDRLAESTGLSEDTIKNMRNNPDKKISIEAIVAVSIAMGLSYDDALKYIERSPSKLTGTKQMRLYRYALKHWNRLPVAEVNRKLIECEGTPLTNLIRGLNEDIFIATS
jgi:DNA-binding Xre family transcriptional regulator